LLGFGHDVGGTPKEAASAASSGLITTSVSCAHPQLEDGCVVTVEPGFYLIDRASRCQAQAHRPHDRVQRVEQLSRSVASGSRTTCRATWLVENLTRPGFNALA